MRSKLDMDFTDLDLENFKNSKLIELVRIFLIKEQSKSLIITLKDEIEKLENERIELKSKMRLNAMNVSPF
jgi:hypothetical protein